MPDETGQEDGVAATLSLHAAAPPQKAVNVGARIGCVGSTRIDGNASALDSALVTIAFEVPGQPQGKGRPRIGKVGQHARMFTPAKTMAYEGLIAFAAQAAMAGRALIDGPCACTILIDCQVPESWSRKKREAALAGSLMPMTKPDSDNVAKAVYDACNGVVWRDDVQVVDGAQRKRYAPTPRLRVVIRPIEPEGGLL